MSFAVGEERRFDGIYIAHWEVSRFETVSGRWFFGLLAKIERCQLETADGVEPLIDKLFGGREPENWRHSGGARFAMSFDGRVVERGHSGHKGWCRWRVLVLRWLRAERVGGRTNTLT
jgi:hypothetical protein